MAASGTNATGVTAALYHLGCGDSHLDGFVNVDVRSTPAVDLTADLNTLDLPRPARVMFSNAFFEHLMRNARLPHLQAARRLLTEQGALCYIGIPDFRAVAEQYVQRGPGVVGPTFDLYNVYRFSHGDPEQVDDWWFEQLHKSLFDAEEVDRLLADSGFASHVVFDYIHSSESVPVTMGFYATPASMPLDRLQEDCVRFLAQFDGRFLVLETLRFVDGKRRSPLGSRISSSRLRRRVRPYTSTLARYLARV